MEVLIGFAVGYWVGTRQGREGIARALDSARDIYASPEARRLVEEGLTAVRAAVLVSDIGRKVNGDRRRAVIRDVLDEIVESRFGRQSAAA